MTELELLKNRREDLKKIESARTTSVPRRLAAQAELREVNARMKEIHIEIALADKRAADARNAAGQAEYRSNLVRSEMNTSPPPKTGKSKSSHVRHTGEYVLVLAKRLRGALAQIRAPLPHTVVFLGELDAFILAQKHHAAEFNAKIAASRAELNATDPPAPATDPPVPRSEWAQTWEAGKASE